ncbi:hypothetical protein XF36_13730 [Pseudonocardia sp. HH130629-09]|nr:PucR family transcriptional regulator ligand-binding domain-containing protein [Pseudonocardia sp. HH130629-09]ALE84067.1 hypothetical protein XF36_13730 [Pseudonocardia sp. HH130629-09]
MDPPSLQSLLAREPLGLRLLTPDSVGFPRLRWVAFTELADPTPYLQGGELVLTSGKVLPASGPELSDYVLRLTRRRVAGLGFGVDRVHAGVPADLVAQAAAVGLPVLEVPSRTPFAMISREVTELVAAAERDAVEKPLRMHRRLLAAAERRDATTAVADELAALVGGHVVLLGPQGEIVHRTGGASDGLVATIGSEVRDLRPRGYGASAALNWGSASVTIQPLGRRSRPGGHIGVVIGHDEPDHGRSAVLVAVTLLTLITEQEIGRRDQRRRVRRQVADLVLAEDLAAARAVAATEKLLTGTPAAPVPGRVRALVMADAPRAPHDVAEHDLETGYVTELDGNLVAVLPVEVVDGVLAGLTDHTVRVGVSRTVALAQAHTAVEQARRAVPGAPVSAATTSRCGATSCRCWTTISWRRGRTSCCAHCSLSRVWTISSRRWRHSSGITGCSWRPRGTSACIGRPSGRGSHACSTCSAWIWRIRSSERTSSSP